MYLVSWYENGIRESEFVDSYDEANVFCDSLESRGIDEYSIIIESVDDSENWGGEYAGP